MVFAYHVFYKTLIVNKVCSNYHFGMIVYGCFAQSRKKQIKSNIFGKVKMEIKKQELSKQELDESRESFSKSLFYIQLISLVLAILSFFLIK
jgi:hypothetical protein